MRIDGLAQWVPEEDERVEERRGRPAALGRRAAGRGAGGRDATGPAPRWTFGGCWPSPSGWPGRRPAVRARERVAVWAGNIPEWVVLEFGAALAGLTLVTVDPACG